MLLVTTPVGAHPEVIESGASGLLVPPGEVDALRRIVDDVELRERLRDGARRRFLGKFDVRAYAERLTGVHASMLSSQTDMEPITEEAGSVG
jgi:glycosyltransferase involved in cell wall biosynthesis